MTKDSKPQVGIARVSAVRMSAPRTGGIRKVVLAGIASAGLLATVPAAAQFQAQANSQGKARMSVAGDLSGHLAAVSDYRFRGLSRTFRDPAIQGGVELTLPNSFYIGTFASIVDKEYFANSRGYEWDVYGGYRWRVNEEVTMDAGLIQYMFPTESQYSTLEGYVGATWRWFSLKYYHTLSNKYFGDRDAKNSRYLNLSAVYPLANDLRVQASIGKVDINNNPGDYFDYMLGVAKDWKGMTFGASFVGTDTNDRFTNRAGKTRKLAGDGFIFSVSKSF